ncbi:MAG: ABC transporter ATP-binding protein [Candidatus Nanoarchaeia archaeon]|jgi:putative ABC transport system ATP-binding protein|nr:ABC transporter ATP-binding protein [Candidatus Nanoarchaeia archaeon]|tara:strand:- start:3488 stop:4171 length:684 start_codon:yes stop_codon:yes gene_type:complete
MIKTPVIQLENVSKIYGRGRAAIHANKNINLTINKNEFVVIIGPSGSGKSTLLNLIGSLDYPSKGAIKLDGQNIAHLDESELAQIRGRKIGFVFQSFHLIQSMTALENVMLPLTFQNMSAGEKQKRAINILTKVGLKSRMTHLPGELSGGENQRVAIARALANNPEVIIADEPTGNLDQSTGKKIMDLLLNIYKKEGKTVIIVTHDRDLVNITKSEKVYKIVDGELV